MRRMTGLTCALLAGASLMGTAPVQAQTTATGGAAPADAMAHHGMHHAHSPVTPTPEQRGRIEEKLRRDGYVNWHDIHLNDDGSAWMVGDAVAEDGNVFTLMLAASDYTLVSRTPKALH